MKRFIDLRGQGTGSRFAWWDTCFDHFETHGGSQDWNTAQEFLKGYEGDEADRYKSLMPAWAWEPPPDPDERESGTIGERW